MPRSVNPFAQRTLCCALLLLVLTGCGLARRDQEPAPPDVVGQPGTAPAAPGMPGTTRPGVAKPAAPAVVKPADKGDPQQRFAEALELMRSNQSAEAEAAFMALTADFPEFSGPWTDLGIIYAKSNRRDAALAVLTRAVAANKANAIAQNWLGILYREARDYSRAERAYRAALDAQPNYGIAHLNLGILYDEYLKKPNDALPHYRAYQQSGGKDDLRVLAWVAEIEAAQKAAKSVPVEPRR